MSIASGKLLDWQDRLSGQPGQQGLVFVNGPDAQDLLRDVVHKLAKPGAALTNQHFSEMTFLLTLSRMPTEADVKTLDQHFRKVKDRRQFTDDLMHALINTREFVFNPEAAKP